ncbi:MAG: hypothetical protein MUF21_06000 [Gemmatimonadaceae bacterium]|nr:hypothetical protein [Gemmatimonadaceae bacterium]
MKKRITPEKAPNAASIRRTEEAGGDQDQADQRRHPEHRTEVAHRVLASLVPQFGDVAQAPHHPLAQRLLARCRGDEIERRQVGAIARVPRDVREPVLAAEHRPLALDDEAHVLAHRLAHRSCGAAVAPRVRVDVADRRGLAREPLAHRLVLAELLRVDEREEHAVERGHAEADAGGGVARGEAIVVSVGGRVGAGGACGGRDEAARRLVHHEHEGDRPADPPRREQEVERDAHGVALQATGASRTPPKRVARPPR